MNGHDSTRIRGESGSLPKTLPSEHLPFEHIRSTVLEFGLIVNVVLGGSCAILACVPKSRSRMF
jgi:hypothetical protein